MNNINTAVIPVNERIRVMRKFLDLTQAEFGEIGDVSQSTQNRFEQGTGSIPLSYLEKISNSFRYKINQDWIFHGTGTMLRVSPSSLIDQEWDTAILNEVEQFSRFLKERSLKPSSKRRLLELLVDSFEE